MNPWVSAVLLVLCAAGFFIGWKFLKEKPAVRRILMLGCGIFGAMLLLYTCLTGFLLAFAQPDPELPSGNTSAAEDFPIDPDSHYLSLDGLTVENGAFWLTCTPLREDLTPLTPAKLRLHENLQASLIPGWDDAGRRCELFTAKDFSLYWENAIVQGFPAEGSVCHFTLSGSTVTELHEIAPTPIDLMEGGHHHD